MRKRVLVTGATGLVGGFVVEELLKRHAQPICLVRDTVNRSYLDRSGLRSRVTVVHGDLEDERLMLRIMNEYQVEGVIHLAAQTQVRVANEHPLPTLRTNIGGTWNLLEAARQCRKHLGFFVVASSDKAYGEALTRQYDENHPLRAVYPYDVSKACTEMIARSYAMTYELPISTTRCGNFFGPGDLNWDRLIPHAVESYLNGKAPVIRSNGKLVRDYFYVKDGAAAYVFLAEKMLADTDHTLRGESFNFSYGHAFSVLEILEKVANIMGASSIKPQILDQASHEIQFQSLSSEKARSTLGWKPRYDFDDALRETIEWYRNEQDVPSYT